MRDFYYFFNYFAKFNVFHLLGHELAEKFVPIIQQNFNLGMLYYGSYFEFVSHSDKDCNRFNHFELGELNHQKALKQSSGSDTLCSHILGQRELISNLVNHPIFIFNPKCLPLFLEGTMNSNNTSDLIKFGSLHTFKSNSISI